MHAKVDFITFLVVWHPGSPSLPIRSVQHVADKWLIQDTMGEPGTAPWMATTMCGLQHTHIFHEYVDVGIASHIPPQSKWGLLTPLHWSVRGVESYPTYGTTFGNLAGPRAWCTASPSNTNPSMIYETVRPWVIQTFVLLQQNCIFTAAVLVCHRVTVCPHPPLRSLSSTPSASSLTCQSCLQDGLSAISESSMHLLAVIWPMGSSPLCKPN